MSDIRSWADSPAEASRWGHYGPAIFIGVVSSSMLLQLSRPYPDALQPLVSISFIALLLLTLVEIRRHDSGMCEVCVSSMPLNPSQSAQTLSRRLKAVHLTSERPYAQYYLVALIASCIIPFLVPAAFHEAARVLWLLGAGSVAYLMLGQSTHRRLQPWCPHCDHNGGSEVDQDTPTPIDSLSG